MPLTTDNVDAVPAMDNKETMNKASDDEQPILVKDSTDKMKEYHCMDENGNNDREIEKEPKGDKEVEELKEEHLGGDDATEEKGTEEDVTGDKEQLQERNGVKGEKNDKQEEQNLNLEVAEKKDEDGGWENIERVEEPSVSDDVPVDIHVEEVDTEEVENSVSKEEDEVGSPIVEKDIEHSTQKDEASEHVTEEKEIPKEEPFVTPAEEVNPSDNVRCEETVVQENETSAPLEEELKKSVEPVPEPQKGEPENVDEKIEVEHPPTEEVQEIPPQSPEDTETPAASDPLPEPTVAVPLTDASASCANTPEENKKGIDEEKESVCDVVPSIDSIAADSSASHPTGASAVSPTVEPPAIVISPAVQEEPPKTPDTLEAPTMSACSTPTPTIRAEQPVPPPRRPSSAVLTGTLKRTPTSSRNGGKLFNTLPRSTLSSTQEEVGRKKKKGMFSWLGGDSSKKKNKEVLESVSDGLRKIYKQKLYPLEEFYKFHDFHSPALDDPDFDAKPMILLVGQYSTGKTTFIRYLLEQDFPGIRIGPEPTTDRFIAVMYGEEEGVIPGNALVVDAKKQFRALSGFGNAFLNRFQCSSLQNQVLESVTIVDTPGILSGEKQRIDRGYDFTGVLEWFAERVDRIILLFDAHKLDISDEFKRCIEALAGNEDKIRIVLNKSDMVDHQQLMRVYGALMWSLGKVFRTPEVSRVYLGSFWDHPLHYDINRRLFQDEQHDLFQDLQALPRNAALRKLNDLIKRARLAKVHAYIISELRKQMPSMLGKEKKKKELIQNLDKIFEQIQREHNISPGDFPDINKMRERLQNQDFTKFNPLKPKLLEVVDGMLASDIARLMAQIPKEEQTATNGTHELPTVKGGAFSQAQEAETPFGFGRGEGFDKGADEVGWVVNRERSAADSTFEGLGPVNGFVSGRAAKEHMVKSKLPNAVLGKIWKLADVDQDGQLDADEFALANYLINLKLEGHELPSELPTHLIPPAKREKEAVYPTLDEE